MEQKSHNIAFSLECIAQNYPNHTAVVVPHTNSSISFAELNNESSHIASGINQYGLKKGDRVLLFVPFNIKFISITFALFKAGTVPVLIDPGLGKKNVLKCIEEAEPRGIIATPFVYTMSQVFRKFFRSVRYRVTTGSLRLLGGKTLKDIHNMSLPKSTYFNVLPDDPAAILFTSGSTGTPKGVLYTHSMFSNQLETLRSCYGIKPGEIDLPTFPLFSLFGVGIGMTSVIPEMDFTRPAKVCPEKLLKTIDEYNVTSGFGSPALWDTVSRHCIRHNRRLPSLNRVLIAGAPVPGSLLERFNHILESESKVHTPYGATESLPVTTIERKEVLEDTLKKTREGYGTCVGRKVSNITLRIIKIDDGPIPKWNDSLELLRGEIGEIVVKGPWVTQKYFNRNEATELAKIQDKNNSFWHRMGDVGYLDELNRLWFCGRKSQRVRTANRTLFTIPCEEIFNSHPKVKRSALIGLGKAGNQKPVIIIEPKDLKDMTNDSARNVFIKELLELGNQHDHTFEINEILMHPEFPVDIRHNAKIFREQLAEWATNKVPGR